MHICIYVFVLYCIYKLKIPLWKGDSWGCISSVTSFPWGKLPSQGKKEEPSRLLELPVCFTTPGSFQEESI